MKLGRLRRFEIGLGLRRDRGIALWRFVERRQDLPVALPQRHLRTLGDLIEMPIERCRARYGAATEHRHEARAVKFSIARHPDSGDLAHRGKKIDPANRLVTRAPRL